MPLFPVRRERAAALASIITLVALAGACTDRLPTDAAARPRDAGRPGLAVGAGAVVVLPGLTGSGDNLAYDLDDAGRVVGYSFDGIRNRAVTWTSGVVVPLAPSNPGDPYSYALGTSPNGRHVVGSARDGAGIVRAARWTDGATPGSYGVVDGRGGVDAWDVNDAGQAAIAAAYDFAIGSNRAARGNADLSVTYLGTAGGTAVTIDAAGTVGGWEIEAGGARRVPVRWRIGAPTEYLPIPNTPAGAPAGGVVRDMNDHGVAVGYAALPVPGGAMYRGALWRADGSYVPLQPLPGHTSSDAYGINADGVIVGRSDAPPNFAPVIWRPLFDGSYGVPEMMSVPDGMPSLNTYAWRINRRGQAAGHSCCTPNANALLWNLAPANTAPTAAIDAAGAMVEGSLVVFTGSGSDADGDAITFAWDLDDDGAFDDAVGSKASRKFADNGTYMVRLQVSDGRGGHGVAERAVTIANASPAIKTLKLDPVVLNSPVVGQSLPLSFVFRDAGIVDGPWAVSIDWGDGSTTAGAVATQAQVDAGHAYAVRGTYTVRMAVRDKDGAMAIRTIPVIVR